MYLIHSETLIYAVISVRFDKKLKNKFYHVMTIGVLKVEVPIRLKLGISTK